MLREVMEGEKKVVCVTGGAGYLASCLIMKLIQRGYYVRATIRSDPKFNEDVSHLKAIPGAQEKLEIFDADLEDPESFDNIMEGCVGVFHVAQPIAFGGSKEILEKIIKTSLEGTLGILKACLKSKTVKKVVYTSSKAAALDFKNEAKEIDENTWTDVETLRKYEVGDGWYPISKTLSENAALDFAEEHGLDLVTILPSMIVGGFLSSTLPLALRLSLALVLGTEVECRLLAQAGNVVHIEDVVSAHIFLFERPEAKGRYICSSNDITIHDVAKFISVKYPELKLPTELLEEFGKEKAIHYSSKKLLDLGFKFKYGFEDMYTDAIECCKEKGFL